MGGESWGAAFSSIIDVWTARLMLAASWTPFIWQTLRVYLTTWNIDHKISDRDVQLAKYLDASYIEFLRSRTRESVV
jgi:hypothetical protein